MAYHALAASALKALKSPVRPYTFAGQATLIDTKTKLTEKIAAVAAAAVTNATNRQLLVDLQTHLGLIQTSLTAARAVCVSAGGQEALIALIDTDLENVAADLIAVAAAITDIDATAALTDAATV